MSLVICNIKNGKRISFTVGGSQHHDWTIKDLSNHMNNSEKTLYFSGDEILTPTTKLSTLTKKIDFFDIDNIPEWHESFDQPNINQENAIGKVVDILMEIVPRTHQITYFNNSLLGFFEKLQVNFTSELGNINQHDISKYTEKECEQVIQALENTELHPSLQSESTTKLSDLIRREHLESWRIRATRKHIELKELTTQLFGIVNIFKTSLDRGSLIIHFDSEKAIENRALILSSENTDSFKLSELCLLLKDLADQFSQIKYQFVQNTTLFLNLYNYYLLFPENILKLTIESSELNRLLIGLECPFQLLQTYESCLREISRRNIFNSALTKAAGSINDRFSTLLQDELTKQNEFFQNYKNSIPKLLAPKAFPKSNCSLKLIEWNQFDLPNIRVLDSDPFLESSLISYLFSASESALLSSFPSQLSSLSQESIPQSCCKSFRPTQDDVSITPNSVESVLPSNPENDQLVQQLKLEKENLELKVEKLERENAELKSQLVGKQESVNNLNQHLKEIIKDSSKRETTYETMIEGLKKQLVDLVTDKEQKLIEKTNEIEQWKTSSEKNQLELASKTKDIENNQLQIASKTVEIENLKAQLNKEYFNFKALWETVNAEKDKAIEEKKKAIEEKKKAVAEMERIVKPSVIAPNTQIFADHSLKEHYNALKCANESLGNEISNLRKNCACLAKIFPLRRNQLAFFKVSSEGVAVGITVDGSRSFMLSPTYLHNFPVGTLFSIRIDTWEILQSDYTCNPLLLPPGENYFTIYPFERSAKEIK